MTSRILATRQSSRAQSVRAQSARVASSVPVSEASKDTTRARFGGSCIVCGYSFRTQVAHVIPKSSKTAGAKDMLELLLHIAPRYFGSFGKETPENLILLCANHHIEYDEHAITLVPSLKALDDMIEFENVDYKRRVDLITIHGDKADPGRTLPFPPEISGRVQYIPLMLDYHLQIHNETRDYHECFVFDSIGAFKPLPVIPGNNFPFYPLLVSAYFAFIDPRRIRNPLTNHARDKIIRLIDLYGRDPCKELPAERTLRKATTLVNDINEAQGQSSHSRMVESRLQAATSANQEATVVEESMEDEEAEVVGDPSGDSNDDLEGTQYYVDDPPVTMDVLASRLRWQPIESTDPDLSSMRFSTSSDFIAAH